MTFLNQEKSIWHGWREARVQQGRYRRVVTVAIDGRLSHEGVPDNGQDGATKTKKNKKINRRWLGEEPLHTSYLSVSKPNGSRSNWCTADDSDVRPTD